MHKSIIIILLISKTLSVEYVPVDPIIKYLATFPSNYKPFKEFLIGGITSSYQFIDGDQILSFISGRVIIDYYRQQDKGRENYEIRNEHYYIWYRAIEKADVIEITAKLGWDPNLLISISKGKAYMTFYKNDGSENDGKSFIAAYEIVPNK